ncbi:MAG: LysE family translocator [Flavobacteriaceae bacterium]|nr:LysE family translocator [Flavobacteriaceae bacterium]
MDILLSFLLASIIFTLFPGPDLLMVLSLSLKRGYLKGIIFSFGLIAGLFLHTLLLFLGWDIFIGDNIIFIKTVKILGSIYFLFLSITVLLNRKKIYNESISPNSKFFISGLIMNVLNPKVSLFFWSFFPSFIFTESFNISTQYLILGSVFITQAIFIFSFLAFIVDTFSVKFHNVKNKDFINYFQSLLFLILSIYVFQS